MNSPASLLSLSQRTQGLGNPAERALQGLHKLMDKHQILLQLQHNNE